MTHGSRMIAQFIMVLGLLVMAGCAQTTVTPAGPTATVASLPPTSTPPPVTISPTAAPSPATPQPSLLLSSLHMMTARSGWATGQSSDNSESGLFRTDDGGAHWQNTSPVNSPTRLPSVFLVNASNAWLAVPSNGANGTLSLTVYRTSDGGQTWQGGASFSISGGGGPGQMDFVDAEHGWMIAGLGAAAGSEAVEILQTIDGGTHWQPVSLTAGSPNESTPGSLPFSCIKSGIMFLDPNTGWATGSCAGGKLFFYVTHDGGHTWQSQSLPAPSGYAADIFSHCMCAMDPPTFFGQTGLAVVQIYEQIQGAYLFVTQDGGRTWTPHKLPTNQPVGGLDFVDANDGFVTDGMQLYSTHDGGQNWTSVAQLPIPRDNLIGSVDFATANDGWATDGKQFDATHDGGQTWAAITPILTSTSLSAIIPTTGGQGATSTPAPIGQGNIPLSNSPQPIMFPPGGTSASVTVNLIPDVPQSFSVQAEAGQQMILTLNGAASLQVYDTQDHPLTGIVPQPGPLTLGLPTTGNYGIAVRGVGQVTLSVTIPPLPIGQGNIPLSNSPQPITFLPGGTSDSVTVNLIPDVPQSFSLQAEANQQMIITLNGAASVQVYDPQDNPLTGIMPQPGPWTVSLPQSGNYGIAMRGVGRVTLNVTIPPLLSAPTPRPTVPLPASRSPINFPPGNASTTFTTTLVAGVPQGYMLRVLQSQTMYVSVSESASVGVLGPGDVALAITRTGRPGLWTVKIPETGNYTVVLYGTGQASVTIYIPPP